MKDFIKKIIFGVWEIVSTLIPVALYLLIYGFIIYFFAIGFKVSNDKAIQRANESTCDHNWQITSNYYWTYKVCDKCFIKIEI